MDLSFFSACVVDTGGHGSLQLEHHLSLLNRKMPVKSVKIKISKNKKMRFFLMSQETFDPKIGFIGHKVCTVACV